MSPEKEGKKGSSICNANRKMKTNAQGRQNIFELGMNISTTESELEKILADAVKVCEDWVKVPSLQTSRTDEKTAIVEMLRQQAETIIAKRRVNVG